MALTRDDFAKILFETMIPENLPHNERRQRTAPVLATASRLLPDKLYRYRPISDNTIGAFQNDRLYFSSADYYNDVFDCLIFTNKESLLTGIRCQLNSEHMEKVIEERQQQIEQLNGTPYYNEYIDMLSPKNRAKTIEEFIEMVSDEADRLQAYFRSVARTICLTEEVDNSRMWGTYADNSKGFCLEYQFDSVARFSCFTQNDECFDGSARLFPIIYRSTALDGTDFMDTVLLNHFSRRFMRNHQFLNDDLLFTTKVAITKDAKWADEKEWRILASYTGQNIIDDKIASYVRIKPSALYLGIDMEPDKEVLLTKIAKDKGVLIYKMKRASDGSFGLKYEPVLG